MINNRELVLDILLDITDKGTFSHISIGNMLKKYQFLEKTDRAFITRMSEGTMENLIKIDYIINQYSKVPVEKQKPVIRNILRMSVYQFIYMDSVPNHAVVNESVKLTVKRGFAGLKGFVNGVLRNIERNLDNIEYPDASKDLVTHLHVVYSMPKWIVEQWVYQYGVEDAARIIKGLNEYRLDTTVRCNTNMASVDEIIKLLENEGVTVAKSDLCETALYLSNYDYLGRLNTFMEGFISVQDISSMLVATIANPKLNDMVLDVCAAPGGKSLHMCELLKGTGMVIARDLTDYKTSLIQENIDRTGTTNIKAETYDALVLDESLVGKMDVVVCDLPCSGLGVISKKSDIKYNMTIDKQKTLKNIQRDILKNALLYVKPGGTLVYSTCTTNKEENIDNYNWLLSNKGVKAIDIEPLLPKKLKKSSAKDGFVQLLPVIDNTDGFFIGKVEVN